MSRLAQYLLVLGSSLWSALRNPRRAYRAMRGFPYFLRAIAFSDSLRPEVPSRSGGSPARSSALRAHVEAHTSGPGIWKWDHFFDIYPRYLDRLRGRSVDLMEIGVYSGGSLQLWKDYLGESCRIYGVDIDPSCMRHERPGVRVFIGDQGDPAFWSRIRLEVPMLDVLIDDGGHSVEQQIVSFEEMFTHVKPGGFYVCEDVSPDFEYYLAGMQRQLCEAHFDPEGSESVVVRPLQRIVASIHMYPFLAVIERSDTVAPTFVASRRGSVWSPPH
jgi:hypothetical protein